MDEFDTTWLADPGQHAALARLGGVDWVTPHWHLRGPGAGGFVVDGAAAIRAAPELADVIHDILTQSEEPTQHLEALSLVARCFHDGLKVLTVDEATCRTLAEVQVPIAVDDYALPHPSLVVVFDPAYGRAVASPDLPPVGYALVSLRRGLLQVGVASARPFEGRGYLAAVSLSATGNSRTIEQRLRDDLAGRDGPEDAAWCAMCQSFLRIAVNAGLLATWAGVKSGGWLGRGVRTRGGRPRRGPCPPRPARAERLVFDQDVHLLLGITVRDRGPDQGGTHAAPRPGWRRQHWAMVACGPDHSQRRPVLRKRTFVRRRVVEALGIDPNDIATTYEGELPGDEPGGDPAP